MPFAPIGPRVVDIGTLEFSLALSSFQRSLPLLIMATKRKSNLRKRLQTSAQADPIQNRAKPPLGRERACRATFITSETATLMEEHDESAAGRQEAESARNDADRSASAAGIHDYH